MSEQELRTPEDRTTENELICEKLLGWRKNTYEHPDNSIAFTGWEDDDRSTPSFTTWAEAGLILEALAKAGQRPDLGYYTDGEWHCMINATDECMPNMFSTGPAAIRDAALAYIGSLS